MSMCVIRTLDTGNPLISVAVCLQIVNHEGVPEGDDPAENGDELNIYVT